MIFWSLTFIWYKEVFVYFNPVTVILFRLLMASILFVIFALLFKKLQKIQRTHYKLFFYLAFFEPFLYFFGEGYGLKYISATAAAVIVSLIPIFTPFAAYIFFKQKVKSLHLVGLGVSFIGVGMVTFAGSTDISGNAIGVALMFLAVFSALGYGITLVKLLKLYNTFTVMIYQNIIAFILFLPFFFALDLKGFLAVELSFEMFMPLINLAVFGSFVAFTLYANSLRHVGINIANMFTYLIPAFTAVFAYLILKDELTTQSITGVFVVIAGLTIPQLPGMIGNKKS